MYGLLSGYCPVGFLIFLRLQYGSVPLSGMALGTADCGAIGGSIIAGAGVGGLGVSEAGNAGAVFSDWAGLVSGILI